MATTRHALALPLTLRVVLCYTRERSPAFRESRALLLLLQTKSAIMLWPPPSVEDMLLQPTIQVSLLDVGRQLV